MCVPQDLADLGLHWFPSNFFLGSTPLTTLDWNPSLHHSSLRAGRFDVWPRVPEIWLIRSLRYSRLLRGCNPKTPRDSLGGRDPIRPASWRPGLFPLRNSRALCADG